MKDLKHVLFIAVSSLLLSGLVSAPVEASSPYVWSNPNFKTAVRTCSSTKCSVKFRPANKTKFRMHCWVSGQSYTGNYKSTKWFKGWENSRGYYGFVHSSFVYNQVSVPRC